MIMSTEVQPRQFSNVAPFILRLAVAGIFVFAGSRTLSVNQPTLAEVAPAAAQQVQGAIDTVNQAVNPQSAEPVEGAAPVSEPASTGLTWDQITGYGEWGIGLVLLVGFFTRLLALSGVSLTAISALAANGVIACPEQCSRLVEMYNSNPLAMLLVGAVCLSLLISGSGPLGLDRLLFGRKIVKAEE